MNKKFFLVLALASLFISTHGAITQILCKKSDGTTTDTGCASCPNSGAGTCTACKTGYFMSGSSSAGTAECTSCGTGCDACTSASVCTTASAGYFLSSGTATACGDTTGCKVCSSAATTDCTEANPGYWLNSGTATACGDTTGCKVCTSATASDCTEANDGYFLSSGTATACGGTGCKVCSSAATTDCTTALDGYFLSSGTATACDDTTGCKVCSSAAATACTTAAAGYFLSSGDATACADTLNAAGCTAQYTVTSCTFGTIDTQTMCCGVPNCATCGAPATVADANNQCATCSSGYGLVSGACTACTVSNCKVCDTTVATCTECLTGYSLSSNTCVATTPVPSTNSPSSAFNITPVVVYTTTDTTAPAFTAQTGSSAYGPGFDSTTAYVWLMVTPSTTTGTYTINRRTINATGSSFEKSNSSADTAITTSIVYGTVAGYAMGPGYLAIASYVAGTNWNAASGATASEISVTYVAGNGSTATTKALTGNTNTNVFFDVEDVWYLNGTVYVAYTMMTRTAGTATTKDTFAANGIYIQGVVLSSGALLYNTTGGVQAIALTQSNEGTVGTTCTVDTTCASTPSSSVSQFKVGLQNWTATDTVSYLWDDRSSTTGVGYTIKMGTINVTSGAATSGTTLTTTVASTGSGTTASPTVSTSYSIAGHLGSTSTYGSFINQLVTSNDGTTTTYTSTILAYFNGSSTAATNVTVATGYNAGGIHGFGTEDGYVLVEYQSSQTTVASGQSTLVQVERFYYNGSAVSTAVSLGTYSDYPQVYQDTNGSIILGYSPHDTITGKTYSGYLGQYLAQSMAASTLTSIFAFLSLLIVALFAF